MNLSLLGGGTTYLGHDMDQLHEPVSGHARCLPHQGGLVVVRAAAQGLFECPGRK